MTADRAREPFSFAELAAADTAEAAPIETLAASDGVALAYRRYEPQTPAAVLIFHHGGGAHSGAGYPLVGRGLQTDFDIAAWTPDLRGHGHSSGPRGDAPSPEQLWHDVRAFVARAREAHPGLPVFVGGHSSGAGLSLNYASWKQRLPVDGYVFLSPQLGFRSKTERSRTESADDDRPAFVDVRLAPFVLNGMTGGFAMGHYPAVRFRYPPEVLENDPSMVASNTVHFANGLTPRAPRDQFASLDRPFGLWIGDGDELFAPDRVVAYGPLAAGVQTSSTWEIVPGRNHLGILVDAHERIGRFLTSSESLAA